MKTKQLISLSIICALALCLPAAQAQQKSQKDPRVNPPVQPVQPLAPTESSSVQSPSDTGDSAAVPGQTRSDRLALGGARAWDLGLSDTGHNYFLGSLSVYQGGDTNPRSSQQSLGMTAVTTAGANLAFHRLWSRSETTFEYRGAGKIYPSRSDINTSFHEFGFTQEVTARRWKLLLNDQFSYSPDAYGGASGFGRLPSGLGGGMDNGMVNVNRLLGPSQSILSERGARISNMVSGEVDLYTSRVTSLSFTASHGNLHFLDSGFVDARIETFRTGYNRMLTARDTVSAFYSASLFRFQGGGTSIDNHSVFLSYGRRLTGRLAFQVAAGPRVALIKSAGGDRESQLGWTMDTSVHYRLPYSDLKLEYLRGITEGSGLLRGTETDEVRGSVSRSLTRMWTGTLSAGYAHNHSLVPLVSSGERTYNGWRAGVRFDRPVGRYSSMYLIYTAQQQTSNVANCTDVTCGMVRLRHVFGIGFTFRFRPIDIE
jgi:hypothetical protein